MTVCARDNLIIAVAIATLRKEQTHFRSCETLCAVNNFIFAVAIATLRMPNLSLIHRKMKECTLDSTIKLVTALLPRPNNDSHAFAVDTLLLPDS